MPKPSATRDFNAAIRADADLGQANQRCRDEWLALADEMEAQADKEALQALAALEAALTKKGTARSTRPWATPGGGMDQRRRASVPALGTLQASRSRVAMIQTPINTATVLAWLGEHLSPPASPRCNRTRR